ncbi:hypothetical protein FML24_12375 [Klebsiella oxytoca]|nr:hypothetical protein CEQ13_13720 [Klebsiella oxytoca]MBZ7694097.1 hypothetical protein [Klebsiella oxytoca]
MRIVIPLNPCFVLCLSRSHKSPVGGKEEKVLIYNEKELNKVVDIVYPALRYQTGESSPDRCVAPPPGRCRGIPFTLKSQKMFHRGT